MTWAGRIVALWGGALIALACAPATAQPLETQVKAAFLSKFGAFTHWPAAASDAGPVRLCVTGPDPFGAAIDHAAQEQAVGGRRLSVVRLAAARTDCHILYASGSPRQVSSALAAVRGRPVLTVTDAARGGTRGMIHFVVFEDRVRFHVDLAQAQRSGVGLSSKLLSLALSVKR